MIKKICIFIMALMCLICLSSCSVLKEMKEELDVAYTQAEDFCIALANDDLKEAEIYLHSKGIPARQGLSTYIQNIERNNNIDFSKGVNFKNRNWGESAYYDSKYGGGTHKFSFEMLVGKEEVEIYFVFVRKDNEFGIYEFMIIDD